MKETVDCFNGLEVWFKELDVQADSIDYRSVIEMQEGLLEQDHSLFFREEKNPQGKPWAALRQSTIARKGDDTILVDTGRLRDSLTGRTGDSLRKIVEKRDRIALLFDTKVPYSIFHMEKGPHGSPARIHVGITKNRADTFQEQILNITVNSLRRKHNGN